MIGRRLVIGTLLGAVGIVMSGCSHNPSYTYRFKMTVVIETPSGLKTGSSVYEVGAGNKTRLTSEEGTRFVWTKGEAVAVDLDNGQTLFTLLKTGALQGDMASLSMSALDTAFKYDIVESAARIVNREGIRSPAEVKQRDYPMLVTFKDLRDPKSVQQVDPDKLASSFGPGYALKSITVQVTDEPVTTGIEKRLASIGVKPDHGLDQTYGVTANPTLSQQLGYNDFIRRY